MAGISETAALNAGNTYDQSINFRVKVDRKFKIPKEFQNEYIFEEGKEPPKPVSKATDREPNIGPLNKTKIDPAFKVATFSEVDITITRTDVDQFKAWIEDPTKVPTLMSKFETEEAYKNFMTSYMDAHLTIEDDPAVIKTNKRFSIANDEVYEFTTDLQDGRTFDSVIGSLMYSITFAHFYHLCTKDYPAHKALEDYYNDMPDKVDAFAEHFLGENMSAVFGNAIQPGRDPIQYFEELKNFVIDFENQIEPGVIKDIDSYKSEIDDIVNLISATLYKLKRLATPKTFSIKE
jgi:hypothetical protein